MTAESLRGLASENMVQALDLDKDIWTAEMELAKCIRAVADAKLALRMAEVRAWLDQANVKGTVKDKEYKVTALTVEYQKAVNDALYQRNRAEAEWASLKRQYNITLGLGEHIMMDMKGDE